MTIDTSPFAFPCNPAHDYEPEWGMTLRDWFAGQAAIGISGYLTNLDEEELAEETAKLAAAAYSIADAMCAEREKGR